MPAQSAPLLEPFLGAWSLEAWTVTQPGKAPVNPFGEAAKGYIIYTPQGVMSATLMKPDRPRLETSRPDMPARFASSIRSMRAEGTSDAFSTAYFQAAAQYMNYCGRYSITRDTVTHHVEAALIPDWVGTDLVRRYSFENDRLVLTAEEDGVLDQLTWKRSSNSGGGS